MNKYSSCHWTDATLGVASALILWAAQTSAAVLLEENFNNGTPDTEMNQPIQFTSDANGHWFGAYETYYRGTPGDLQYEIAYTAETPAMKIRALNYAHQGDPNGVDTLTNYVLRIGTIKFEGWHSSCAVFIRPRHDSSHLGYGYRFSPAGTANPPAAWNVYYRSDEGGTGTSTLIATLPGATPTVTNLELRVRQSAMQLYMDGVPVNTTPRPTQSTAGTELYQRPLEIIVNAPYDNVIAGTASVKVTLDDVRLVADDFTVPPFEDVPEGTLLAYEGFNYSSPADLNGVAPGGLGFVGSYLKEPSASTLLLLDSLSAATVSPGYAFGALTVEGDRCSVIAPGTVAPENARRSTRWIDMDNFPPQLTSLSNTLVRATGQKIWMSVLAQQEDLTKTGFFGVSLFDNHIESVFLGKASGTTGAGVVWRIEGKGGVNSTGLSTNTTDQLSLLVVRIDWNHDGTTNPDSTPVNPDVMYLWVNPDLSHEPDIAEASAIATRSVTVTNRNPYMHFNKVGFRGSTAGGVLDEFRLGTTFRSVIPVPPELSATRVGANLEIRWKTTPGFNLESTSSLSPASWGPVSELIGFDGDYSVVTVNSDDPARYFRLIR